MVHLSFTVICQMYKVFKKNKLNYKKDDCLIPQRLGILECLEGSLQLEGLFYFQPVMVKAQPSQEFHVSDACHMELGPLLHPLEVVFGLCGERTVRNHRRDRLMTN